MNIYWLLAGGFSLFTFMIHFFVGGREIAQPLLNNETLQKVPKFTSYFCWHMVSILLFVMGFAYLYSAFKPSAFELAFLMSGLSASFIVLNLAIIVIYKLRLWHFPQWTLFLPITLLGFVGFIL